MASSTREVEEGFNIEEQDLEIRGGSTNSYRLVLPEDGYEWRKYGQKFIKNIAKYRSYFRCRESQCKAKKRVEWLTSKPDNIRVIYDGVHFHAPLAQSVQSDFSHETCSNSSGTNSYDLLTQVLESINSDDMNTFS